MINMNTARITNTLNNIVSSKNNIIIKSFRKSRFKSVIIFMKSIYSSLISNLYLYLMNARLNLLLNINLFANCITSNISTVLSDTFLNSLSYFISDIGSNFIYYTNFKLQNNTLLFNIIYFYMYVTLFVLVGLHTSNMSLISLPKTIKLFTLLKSPHTDKKSREQFKLQNHSAMIFDDYNICNNLFDTIGILNSSCFLKKINIESYYAKH